MTGDNQAVDNQSDSSKAKRGMSRTQKTLFFATGWLIVLMPFLFWWNTWFGRHLSDPQLTEYLHDAKKPRHIQHALVQMGDRMGRQDRTGQPDPDPSVKLWYPDLIRLASDPVEEVRNTDAWVMGLDTSGAGFHEALRGRGCLARGPRCPASVRGGFCRRGLNRRCGGFVFRNVGIGVGRIMFGDGGNRPPS